MEHQGEPVRRGLIVLAARVTGALAMLGSVVALVMCFVVVITAPEGGGVDFRLLYFVIAIAVLLPLGVFALQASRREGR